MNKLPIASKPIFKLAGRDDLPFIVEVYNSTIASRMVTADDQPVSVESRIHWFESFNAESRPLWLIMVNETPAGWIGFHSFYGRPAYQATVELSLYLHQDFRAKGLGRFSLEEAIRRAPAYGIQTLLAFIFGHNLPSLNLFSSLGFQNYGLLPAVAEMDGISRDLVILGKKTNS